MHSVLRATLMAGWATRQVDDLVTGEEEAHCDSQFC